MSQDLNNFVSKFFISHGARFSNVGNIINITNIPLDIQNYLGKKEPFVFAFDEQGMMEDPNAELISKGSTIIKLMNEYMQKKGQTTLLKIDFSKEVESLTIPAVLKEGDIYKQEKKERIEYISRFTFQSEFQYLNEKEQIETDIYIKDAQIIDLDISKYNVVEGKSEEVNTQDIKDSYTIARNLIKSKLKPKIEGVSKQLEFKLEKELERINNHYTHNDDEIKLGIKKLDQQLIEAEKEKDSKRIKKINREILEKKASLDDKMREVEKNFFIQDEINKHSLNLNTKLINTTLIYYNNFNFTLYIRNGKIIRSIELNYDPFNNELSHILCDSCKWALKELILCSGGHISCEKCKLDSCDECKLAICKSCSRKECIICNKTLCKRCDNQCKLCFKSTCSNHNRADSLTGKQICNNCGRECCKCKKYFDNKILRSFGPKKICEACFRIDSISKER